MGYKNVCLTCRKAFSNNFGNGRDSNKCQECGGTYVRFNYKFRPPRKLDITAWEVVKFLYTNGFNYQHIVKEHLKIRENGYAKDQIIYAAYPTDLRTAQEFVILYRDQAIDFEANLTKSKI